MKNIILSTLTAFVWLFLSATASAAHFSVTDSLHIKTTLSTSKKELREMITQGLTQEEQLSNLHAQIRQIDDFLNRLGKLEDVRDLPGFDRAAEAFIRELELNLPSIDIIKDLDLDELFKKRSESIYDTIGRDIIIDGQKVGEIDASSLKPQLAFRKTFEHYERVRSAVLAKRSSLKLELEEAMNQLRRATKKAEVDKLSGVINGLQTQIAATDQEMAFASQELAARYYQGKIEKEVQQKIQQQHDVASFKTGLRKSLRIFSPPTKPAQFKPRNK